MVLFVLGLLAGVAMWLRAAKTEAAARVFLPSGLFQVGLPGGSDGQVTDESPEQSNRLFRDSRCRLRRLGARVLPVKPGLEVPPALRRVLEAPRDLDARRAYASALAPAPLGEYVAAATELLTAPSPGYFEQAERAQELFAAHRGEWSKNWGREHLFALGMYAGLPDLVHLEKGAPADVLSRLFGTCPIHELRLRNVTTEDVRTLMRVAGRERVRSLTLRFEVKRAGKALKDCLFEARWPLLEDVRFGDAGWGPQEVAPFLARLPALRRISGAAFPVLEGLPQLGRLEHVGLSSFSARATFLAERATSLASMGVAMFVPEGSISFPSVRKLYLGSWRNGTLDAFPSLTELSLPFGPDQEKYAEGHIDDMARAPIWENLERLAFGGPAASLELLTGRVLPRCRKLRHLRLRNAGCVPAIVEALPELETLSVDAGQGKHNPPVPLDDAQLARLASALGPGLRDLDLYGSFTRAGVKAVVERAPRLENVLFSANGFDADCVALLLALPGVRRIHLLVHHWDSIGALRDRPSHGRYLGPLRTQVGPQTDPIWSHELVAPAM